MYVYIYALKNGQINVILYRLGIFLIKLLSHVLDRRRGQARVNGQRFFVTPPHSAAIK